MGADRQDRNLESAPQVPEGDLGEGLMIRGLASSRVLLVRGFTLRVVSSVTNIALIALILPSDLGFFAVIRGALGAVQFGSELGFQLALIRRRADPTAAELAALTGFRFLVLLALLLVLVLIPPARTVFGIIPPEYGGWMVAVLAALVISSPIQSACKILLERELQFTKLSLVEVNGVLIQNVGLVLFALAGRFRIGIFILAIALSFYYLAALLWVRPVSYFSFRLRPLWPVLGESLGFSTSRLLDVARQSLTPILIARLFDLNIVGLWDFAIRVGQFLHMALEGYLRAGVAVAGRLDNAPDLLRRFARSMLREVAEITYPLTALLFLAMPLLGALIPTWAPGVQVAVLYLLAFGCLGVFEAALWPVIVVRFGPGPAVKHQAVWMIGVWTGVVGLWLAGGTNIAIPGIIGVTAATAYLVKIAVSDGLLDVGRVLWRPALVLAGSLLLFRVCQEMNMVLPVATAVAAALPGFALGTALLRKWSGRGADMNAAAKPSG